MLRLESRLITVDLGFDSSFLETPRSECASFAAGTFLLTTYLETA